MGWMLSSDRWLEWTEYTCSIKCMLVFYYISRAFSLLWKWEKFNFGQSTDESIRLNTILSWMQWVTAKSLVHFSSSGHTQYSYSADREYKCINVSLLGLNMECIVSPLEANLHKVSIYSVASDCKWIYWKAKYSIQPSGPFFFALHLFLLLCHKWSVFLKP